jgi:excisionase family DNA binding protein
MNPNPARGTASPPRTLSVPSVALLTPKEAARLLKVSTSFLAKARMRGDGPPFIKVGRSVRYSEAALVQWMKSRNRLSTSEH